VPRVRELVAEATAVPELLHTTLAAVCDECGALEAHMQAVERQLAALAATMPDVTLLQTIPGVGLITATALVARVNEIRRFYPDHHDAPRASRPCGRPRRCAARSLDPCSRRGRHATMRRRKPSSQAVDVSSSNALHLSS
jgi:transposase